MPLEIVRNDITKMRVDSPRAMLFGSASYRLER